MTDTTLFTANVWSIFPRRRAQTIRPARSSGVTTSVTNDTYQVVGTRTATGAGTVTNAGLFDAASGGNLFLKGDFTGIALASGDSIQFTIKAQFA